MESLAVVEEQTILAQESEAKEFVERVRAIVIDSDQANVFAGTLLHEIVSARRDRAAFFAPTKTAADKLHKLVCAQEKRVVGPLQLAEDILRPKIRDYHAEQDRLRRLAAAEEAARLRREAEEQQLAVAARLESAGLQDVADSVLEQAIATPAPATPKPVAVPQAAGVGMRKKPPQWRLLDRSKIVDRYLIPDEGAIGRLVRQVGKDAETIVGAGSIEVYFEETVTVR